MKNLLVIGLILITLCLGCQPSYPTISETELQAFVEKGEVERIVIENKQIAFVKLKTGQEPFDYQMPVDSVDLFYKKLELYNRQSDKPRREWIYPIATRRTRLIPDVIGDIGVIAGILTLILPIVVIVWVIYIWRRKH